MQAIILVAGIGKRLNEITKGLPKCLTKVGDKTFLRRMIDQLKDKGVKNIIIVTGHEAELIKQASPEAIHIHNELYEKSNNIISVLQTKQEVLGQDFLILYGDIIFDSGILLDCINSEESCMAISEPFAGDTEKIKTDGDYVKDIGNHIVKHNGNFIGISKIKAEDSVDFFEWMEFILPESKDCYYTKALKKMISNGHQIEAIMANGRYWAEMDYPEDYEKIKRRLTSVE